MHVNTAQPRAQRLRRPSWRDGRLLVGVLLMLASVALGARVISSADHTVPVYAAASALVPGERLTPDRLTRVDVSLGAASGPYLEAAKPLPEGAVVVREVRAGELLPSAALASSEAAARTPVMVPVSSDSARVLTAGSVVDVWVNDKVAANSGGLTTYGTPRRMVESAPVGRVPEADATRMSGVGTTGVQVLVPNSGVERLIAAMDQGAKITLVPAAGSAQRDK